MSFYVLAYSSPEPPPTLSSPKTSVNPPLTSPPIPPSPTSPSSASYPDPTSSSPAPNLEKRLAPFSEELKARLWKLEELAERKKYEELVKDITQSKGTDEPFSSYKDQLGFAISSALFDYGQELWCQISMLVCLATFLIVSNNESFDPYQEFEYLPLPLSYALGLYSHRLDGEDEQFESDEAQVVVVKEIAALEPQAQVVKEIAALEPQARKKLRHLNPKPVHDLAFLYVQRRENGAHVH
ncbi:hypothetical protein RHGRI_000881 [Rhododendron griersonianum]|uniref:Uncharacterized protein n=1 Tax=Rhododendron griersonianum TaxID=479676 RepID=A0AAV6LJE3_9ERIC|nr:hypothetical protein RHGRI_000881 [Rhododendron griersonianum]